MKASLKDFRVVFVTAPSDTPENVNATVLGVLGVAPDLARRLGVDIERVTITLHTKSGQTASARLERSDREIV